MTNPGSKEVEPETNVHALTVLVCQDCIDLKGEMCHNPECVFCRRTIAEVRHHLDAMLLCPIVDGERLILVGDAVTIEDTRISADSAASKLEEAWLIEKMHNGNVHYISANYVLEWTDDPNKALRLARREDAEALCTIVEDADKIASHEWVPAPPAPKEEEAHERPKVICLCGSTRFIEQFAITTWELEREGFIVLGCTLLPMWYCSVPSHFGEATGTKEQCDELHKRKIDLADEVLILNIGGYIGESTANEIAYATELGKPVRYLESTRITTLPAPVVSDYDPDD